MIELPPAVENIYATNDAINGTRFNPVANNSASQLANLGGQAMESHQSSKRRLEEVKTVSASLQNKQRVLQSM